jgi:hypothetical protein
MGAARVAGHGARQRRWARPRRGRRGRGVPGVGAARADAGARGSNCACYSRAAAWVGGWCARRARWARGGGRRRHPPYRGGLAATWTPRPAGRA